MSRLTRNSKSLWGEREVSYCVLKADEGRQRSHCESIWWRTRLGGFVSFWRLSIPSAGGEETAWLCSVPLWIQNNNNKCSNKMKVNQKQSHHKLMLPWTATGFGVSRLLNWEWRHCDPGGASGLTANRDRVNVLGAGQPESQFSTPFWALVSSLCSWTPQALVVRLLISPKAFSLFEAMWGKTQQTLIRCCTAR